MNVFNMNASTNFANQSYFLKNDENTRLNELSLKGLLVPFVSTSFWEVSVQCRLLHNHILSYNLLSHYYISSTLPSRFILAELEIFGGNHINLASLCGNGQPTTMYAPFDCNWRTLSLSFIFKFYSKCKLKLRLFVELLR